VSVQALDSIFNPKRIALIGVSPNPNSVSGKVLQNLVGGGFHGVVYPVNPDSEAVLGVPCYSDLRQLPKIPDLAILCSPPAQVPAQVRECGKAGIQGVIIITAGFREIGAKGIALEQQILEEQRKFDGMRIIGPNCLGAIVPGNGLNASFASGNPQKGHIAFISQSGALCTSVLDWALEEKVGFSYFVSIGNTLDVDFGDLIDYLGEDENTESIILYVESISNTRKFMAAARAFARTKPILVYKAGRFPQSAEVAASHTGAMAAEDAVYDAAFQRTGLARVYDFGEIFDCAELVGRKKIPKGPHLSIVTNAGGPGVMATDALIDADGVLATLSEETLNSLNENLPPAWSHGNPVDVLGDARSKRITKAIKIVLKDPGVDAVLVILTPQAMTNPTTTARAVGELAASANKPVLAAWVGGERMQDGIRLLNEAGVPTYTTPERAVRAFMTLVSYARNLESLYETPKDIPVEFTLDRKEIRSRFDSLVADQGEILPETISKSILEAYGIPVTRPLAASSAGEAVKEAEKIGYPVVLKVLSPDLTHKTDAGGVILNLKDAAAVEKAYKQIMASAKKYDPNAKLDGVTVQSMMDTAHGTEMILGIKKDSLFGTVILVGAGGTSAELFQDRQLGFPPLNENLARRMLESLRIWPLLQGYRGRPPAHVDRLIEILIRLSYLAADFPEILELDINPLLVTGTDVVALDSRIRIDPALPGKSVKPYSHLALHPYPEEYVETVHLPDSTPVLLRPIKPEDEPLWFDLLGSCSRESIYMRFRYMFHWQSHDVASRYCFIDYDREVAIVAEISENGKRKLLGVGRMVADPDHEVVEYAILIADAWQSKGLGGILTDYCMKIAGHWGMKRIVAQTTADNHRMIAVFRKRGFDITQDPETSLVEVGKSLK
jgi:acetyltransferase